jgi:hypothetical protein
MAVLHIGSCVAVIPEPDAKLTARTNVNPPMYDRLSSIAKPYNIELERPENPQGRHQWYGEAKCWALSGIPMISIAGASEVFHTIRDRPELVTTPEIMYSKAAMFCEIATALIRGDL